MVGQDGWTSSQISTVLNRLTSINGTATNLLGVAQDLSQLVGNLNAILLWGIGLWCVWFGFTIGEYFIPTSKDMAWD